jgi:DNA gyrase/topoisomerase IV subunit A
MNDRSGADARERVEDQIHIYEALVAAIERRWEVYELLEGAEDPEAANRGLQALLGTDEAGARAVIDMQFRKLTVTERAKVAEGLRELKQYASTLG